MTEDVACERVETKRPYRLPATGSGVRAAARPWDSRARAERTALATDAIDGVRNTCQGPLLLMARSRPEATGKLQTPRTQKCVIWIQGFEFRFLCHYLRQSNYHL